MAIEHTLNVQWSSGGRSHSDEVTQSGSGDKSIEETIPDASTDLLVALTQDVSAMKMLFILADQDLTLETNDGATPDDTLNLVAGEPVIWHVDGFTDNPLTLDVTALYFTNAAGADAEILIEILEDVTP